jgi:hypothetical protein
METLEETLQTTATNITQITLNPFGHDMIMANGIPLNITMHIKCTHICCKG